MTTKGADSCGPYLQAMPANPFNGNNTIRFETGQSTAGSGKAGWVLNANTGDFQADDSADHASL